MSFTDTPAGPSTKSENSAEAMPSEATSSGLAASPGAALTETGSSNAEPERLSIGGFRVPRTGTIVLLLVALAFVLRLWELGDRPLHHDESLDAWWSWQFRNGRYEGYDPVYHGPLRFYITAGFFEIFGESESIARLFSALTGTAVVGLPWFLRHELRRPGTIAAAAALTISPTMLYYSRFGREDAQMVFLALLAMVLGLSYLRSPRVATAVGLSFTLVCSFAIKESTYLFGLLLAVFLMIVIAAQFDAQNRVELGLETDPEKLNPAFVTSALVMASVGLTVVAVVGHLADELFPMIALYFLALIAFVVMSALPRLRVRNTDPDFEWPSTFKAIGAIGVVGWAITLGVFAVSWFLFFTVWGQVPGDWASGFTRAIDYWDSQQEVNRGGQPWYYYLYALPAYEWLFVALAFVGAWRGLRRPTLLSILMIWFAVGSLILYSYAGERMPWLIAHPLLPILILAAMGVQHLWQHRDRVGMPAVGVALALALLFTAGTSIRSSFTNGADSREILSQAGQATPHLTAALERVENIDAISMREFGKPARLAIGTANAWPYSWYLRDRATDDPESIVWFNSETGPPTDGTADIIIVDRNTVNLEDFGEYQAKLFAMRSWWVPTYNDAGPVGWLRYVRNRELWEQSPNPDFVGVTEVEEVEIDGGIGARLERLRDGANSGAQGWVDFAGADGELVPNPIDPNAFVEPDDGRDGCGSVDQWFLVHNRLAFSESNVYPGPIAEMATLPCVSDDLSSP